MREWGGENFFPAESDRDPACCRAGARAGAGADGQGQVVGKGLSLFGSGHVDAGLKCPVTAPSEVLLHRNAREGSCKFSWILFCPHVSIWKDPSGAE